jgi:uncharacterized protein (TIGR00255 family)
MNSMTGFGRAARRDRRIDIEVEARSVNHRFLSVKVSLPEGLGRYESEVERSVRRRLARGSVNVSVTLKSLEDEGVALPDAERVRRVYKRLDAIRKELGLKGEISLDTLLSLPPLWNGADAASRAAAEAWPAVKKLVEEAVEELADARSREGEAIRRDMLSRLDAIEESRRRIRERAPAVLEAYSRKLDERISGILASKGLDVKADLAKEIALYADRIDVTEELQRLGQHVESFRKIVKTGGQIGRKLDFTIQEMVREINTLASKAADSEISALAVQVKSELEKLKEQAENIE